jgi:hypothetical protein
MSYRITGSLSLLAAALLAPAAAQAASPACTGDNAMLAAGQTTIVRSGSGHTATVTRTDPDGTIHLEQHGEGHAALAVQSGRGGRLVIDQRGTSTDAEVTQDGACNAAELAQSGEGNRAVVSQSGSGNRAVVRQGPNAE